MSNHGLCVSLKKYLAFLVLLWYFQNKLVSLNMEIWLFLLLPTHNHPLSVGSWRLPSRRWESWHTFVTIIIAALLVVNDIVTQWLDRQNCLYRSDANTVGWQHCSSLLTSAARREIWFSQDEKWKAETVQMHWNSRILFNTWSNLSMMSLNREHFHPALNSFW